MIAGAVLALFWSSSTALLSSRTSLIELIEAEPALRVGRVAAVLGGLLADDGPRLAREVGVPLLAASVLTEALGLADVDDFNDATESGDVTEGRAVALAGEEGLAAAVVLEVGAVAAGLAVGASDARRPGAAGAAVVDGRAVDGGGGIDVLLLPVAVDETVLRMVVAAAGGFDVAPDVAVALVAVVEGAARAEPAPNVPELSTYRQIISSHYNESAAVQRTFFTIGVAGAVAGLLAVVRVDTDGLPVTLGFTGEDGVTAFLGDSPGGGAAGASSATGSASRSCCFASSAPSLSSGGSPDAPFAYASSDAVSARPASAC